MPERQEAHHLVERGRHMGFLRRVDSRRLVVHQPHQPWPFNGKRT